MDLNWTWTKITCFYEWKTFHSFFKIKIKRWLKATREEFEKNLKERLENAIKDYKKEFKEIDKTEVLDAIDFILRDEKLEALELRLKNRIISENNATITFFNFACIKGYVKFNDIENIEFEIKVNF